MPLQKLIAGLLMAFLAAGCGDADATCEEAARNAAANDRELAGESPEKVKVLRQTVIGMCRDERWSAERRNCFARLKPGGSVDDDCLQAEGPAAERQALERRRRDAEAAAERAREQREAAEAEKRELARQLAELSALTEELEAQFAEANSALEAATTPAARDQAAARLAELRRQQADARRRIEKVRAGVKLRCPPDQPLC